MRNSHTTLKSCHLPFGHASVTVNLPAELHADVVSPMQNKHPVQKNQEIITLIQNSIKGIPPPPARIGIAINDKTRPVPHSILLPAILDVLNQSGHNTETVTFFIANGTHKPMPIKEVSLIAPPDLVEKYHFHSHDCDDVANLQFLGNTTKKTPVYVNRPFYECDYKIVIGTIEPHHFMGYSGGSKTAAIGLAGRSTINANHSMLIDPACKICSFANNPMRMDVEEIGNMIRLDLAVNVILDWHGNILQTLIGNPKQIMVKGAELSSKYSQTKVNKKFDLVIASAGGYPKDINFYQSQKAITNALELSASGGTIILVAACEEGHGSEAFFSYICGFKDPRAILVKFPLEPFIVGPHKALLLARQLIDHKVYLHSSLKGEVVKNMLMEPIELNDIHALLHGLPKSSTIAVIPDAVHTIPYVVET